MNTSATVILRYMYLFGLALTLASLPLSKFMMSVAQFYLGGVIILQCFRLGTLSETIKNSGKVSAYLFIVPLAVYYFLESVLRVFRSFFRKENYPAIIFVSIFLLHVAGLIYTTDFQYALKDLRIKLPLFIFPVVLSTARPISEKQLKYLLLLFVAAVSVATLICFSYLFRGNVDNIRDISVFISHIRFSLLIVFAFFILLYYTFKTARSIQTRILLLILSAWLIAYLLISVSITGLSLIFIVGLGLSLYYLWSSVNKTYSFLVSFAVLAALTIASIYIINIYQDVFDVESTDINDLEAYTSMGNPYWHDLDNKETENGNYVWYFLCRKEYAEAWNQRSKIHIDSLDKKGQYIEGTLLRYLTSKGLKKDAEGVNSLSREEIELVENGIANYNYIDKSKLYNRIYAIFWGLKKYRETGNASGHSVMQRLIYWKVSLGVINEKWLSGVGTGDVLKAIDKQYDKMNTGLAARYQWRSHNQYLSLIIAFGIPGLIWFLFAFIYPAVVLKRFSDYYFVIFFSIIMISMLTEDTIETQAGATITACFYSLLAFAREHQSFR